MFDMDFMEVGNPMVLGMIEEDQEDRVNAAIDYIARHYGYHVPQKAVDEAIDDFGIDYFALPAYLAKRFDCFEVI